VSEQPHPESDGQAQGRGYVLFISKPTGYEMLTRDGDPPVVGSIVELGGEEGRWFVSRVSPSPLPQDRRPCAYLQQLPS
jgi:hypothetical protein